MRQDALLRQSPVVQMGVLQLCDAWLQSHVAREPTSSPRTHGVSDRDLALRMAHQKAQRVYLGERRECAALLKRLMVGGIRASVPLGLLLQAARSNEAWGVECPLRRLTSTQQVSFKWQAFLLAPFV